VTHDGDMGKMGKEQPPTQTGSQGEKLESPRRRTVATLKVRLIHILHGDNVFLFLLGARWLSLLPPALALLLGYATDAASWWVFALALSSNFVLTAFHGRLNQVVLRAPYFLGLDMATVAAFIAFTRGTSLPYGFYALTPLLAAAFFFRIRGGLLAATAFTPLYLLALGVAQARSGGDAMNVPEALAEIIGFYLIALVFGYPSVLLNQLHAAMVQLHNAQQEAARAETWLPSARWRPGSATKFAIPCLYSEALPAPFCASQPTWSGCGQMPRSSPTRRRALSSS
jgi:hypothetical protein